MSQEMWNAPPGFRPTKSAPCSPAKPLGVSRTRSESFHVTHKVPVGDTPYVRAKNVQAECLAEKKGVLDMFRNRLDAEKAKHHDSIQETKKVILNGFQTGFSSVLDSMSEFSKASLKMYTELATHGKLSS